MSGSPELGNLIGENQRYRLERSLGSGGMGEVFLASDLRLHKSVALKLLKERLVENLSIRRRFEQEVRVCAQLSSNYIVKVTDSGVTPEGYPFYVMEYLEGRTLSDVMCREDFLSPDRVVRIGIQICEGLKAAHDGFTYEDRLVTIVHRDLKPENIFLVESGMGELVKILDFGIAKICSDIQTGGSLMAQTQEGTFLGTAHYASPEQIRGDQITPASDIYSLGVMLYEMFSGTDPFDLRSEGSVKMSTWMKAHLARQPIPLRDQPSCRQLSSDLEAVVMRCLEKSPDRRFASAAELRMALFSAPIHGGDTTASQFSSSSTKIKIKTGTTSRQPSNFLWIGIGIVTFLLLSAIGVGSLLKPPKKPECTFEKDKDCFCKKYPDDPKCPI